MNKLKPNFNDIVNELLAVSTQSELELLTGVDQATISRLKNGNPYPRLSYTNGAALIAAHKKIKRRVVRDESK